MSKIELKVHSHLQNVKTFKLDLLLRLLGFFIVLEYVNGLKFV